MAIRVTSTQVRDAIYLSNAFTDPMVDQCIETANAITDGLLVNAGVIDPILTKIELYLAAHFCSVREPQLLKEEIGGRDATVKEERKSSLTEHGFNSTAFGQQAVDLDYSGTLADMAKKNKKQAGITTYGPYSEG